MFYIPRWKRMLYLRRIIISLIIAAIAIAIFLYYPKIRNINHSVENMDRAMIQYRTGGPLILYNRSSETIGFYLNDLPIYHNIFVEDIPTGIFRCTYNSEDKCIEIYDFDYHYFGTINIEDNLEIETSFGDSILVVYNNEKF